MSAANSYQVSINEIRDKISDEVYDAAPITNPDANVQTYKGRKEKYSYKVICNECDNKKWKDRIFWNGYQRHWNKYHKDDFAENENILTHCIVVSQYKPIDVKTGKYQYEYRFVDEDSLQPIQAQINNNQNDPADTNDLEIEPYDEDEDEVELIEDIDDDEDDIEDEDEVELIEDIDDDEDDIDDEDEDDDIRLNEHREQIQNKEEDEKEEKKEDNYNDSVNVGNKRRRNENVDINPTVPKRHKKDEAADNSSWSFIGFGAKIYEYCEKIYNLVSCIPSMAATIASLPQQISDAVKQIEDAINVVPNKKNPISNPLYNDSINAIYQSSSHRELSENNDVFKLLQIEDEIYDYEFCCVACRGYYNRFRDSMPKYALCHPDKTLKLTERDADDPNLYDRHKKFMIKRHCTDSQDHLPAIQLFHEYIISIPDVTLIKSEMAHTLSLRGSPDALYVDLIVLQDRIQDIIKNEDTSNNSTILGHYHHSMNMMDIWRDIQYEYAQKNLELVLAASTTTIGEYDPIFYSVSIDGWSSGMI